MLAVDHSCRLKIFALASIYLLAGARYALAQNNPVVPDAGSLLRDIERQQVQPMPKAMPKPEIKKEPESKKVEATVLVREFKFEGNHHVSTEELTAHYEKYLSQPLTFSEIQNIAAEISLIYSAKNLVAVGLLPKQDVTEGVITIRIIEAKFGGSVFDEEQKKQLKLVDPAAIERFISEGLVVGELMDISRLDRSVLLANDLSGINVQSGLISGEKDDETLVLIQANDKPQFGADVSVDNQGSRSTGSFKKSANLNMASPAGIGDLASVSLLNSQGTDYGRLSYSVPIGYDGWRAGVNASHMRYEVITPESQSTRPKGSSDVVGLDLQYPMIRSASQNLYFNTAYDLKYFKNERIGTSSYETQSDYRLDILSIGLSGNQYDDYFGGGLLSASVNFGVGSVNLNGSPNQVDDAASSRTSGSFSRIRWNMSRQQNLVDDLSLSLTLSGQKAAKNLDSSEKFYLGGISGVRAYPNSEGAGSDGQMINIELRQRLPEDFTVSAFFDWGHIKQYVENAKVNGDPLSTLNTYNLSGYGLSLAWVGPYQANLKATWSRRIGSNPYPTANGNDQDGSLAQNRFWLSASIPF